MFWALELSFKMLLKGRNQPRYHSFKWFPGMVWLSLQANWMGPLHSGACPWCTCALNYNPIEMSPQIPEHGYGAMNDNREKDTMLVELLPP